AMLARQFAYVFWKTCFIRRHENKLAGWTGQINRYAPARGKLQVVLIAESRDHGTGWGTRLVPSSSFSIARTSLKTGAKVAGVPGWEACSLGATSAAKASPFRPFLRPASVSDTRSVR